MFARTALALALTFSTTRSGGDASILDGHWTGAVSREGAIQIIEIDLHGDAKSLTGTYDIPELGLRREPLRELELDGDALKMHFIYGTFETELKRDVDEITGVNAQWGPPVRIHLKRAEAPARLHYEELRFENAAVKLAGTLVLPDHAQRAPVVIVISGSSPQGRHDGDGAWTYRSWGEICAEHGVAALVYDRRGVGESGGDRDSATFDDSAGDVVAAIDRLAQHPAIDPKHIGLVGISQGGWIAPIVAVRDARVSFVVLDVGPSVSVREQELDRIENTLRAGGSSETDIAEALDYERALFEVAYGRRPWSGLEPMTKAAAGKAWAKQLELPSKPDDLDWWKRHAYDPAETLAHLKCPVLALFGAEDPLVPPKKNAPLMQELLRKAGNTDVTLRIFPGVEHGCEVPRRLTGDGWAWPKSFWVWSKKASGFYTTIFGWIERHTAR